MSKSETLRALGLGDINAGAWSGATAGAPKPRCPLIESINPSTGERPRAGPRRHGRGLRARLESAVEAARRWRRVPAPKRGEAVRLIAEELRIHKDALGSLVSLENGKIKAEGDGEVQEMIDIADFAVGQSRMLYGLTMHSERGAAPHVRAVASARRRRRDLRVQFSRGGMVLERVSRRHCRQCDDVEALAENLAVLARRAAHLQPRPRAACPARDISIAHRRRHRARRPIRR